MGGGLVVVVNGSGGIGWVEDDGSVVINESSITEREVVTVSGICKLLHDRCTLIFQTRTLLNGGADKLRYTVHKLDRQDA